MKSRSDERIRVPWIFRIAVVAIAVVVLLNVVPGLGITNLLLLPLSDAVGSTFLDHIHGFVTLLMTAFAIWALVERGSTTNPARRVVLILIVGNAVSVVVLGTLGVASPHLTIVVMRPLLTVLSCSFGILLIIGFLVLQRS